MTNHSFAFPCLGSGSGSLQSNRPSDGATEASESFESVVRKLLAAADNQDSTNDSGLQLSADGSVVADSEANQDQIAARIRAADESAALTQFVSDDVKASETVHEIGNHFDQHSGKIGEGQAVLGIGDNSTLSIDPLLESAELPLTAVPLNVHSATDLGTLDSNEFKEIEADHSKDSDSSAQFWSNDSLSDLAPSEDDAGWEQSDQVAFSDPDFDPNSANSQIVSASTEGVNDLQVSASEGGGEDDVSSSSTIEAAGSIGNSTTAVAAGGLHDVSAEHATAAGPSADSSFAVGDQVVEDASIKSALTASGVSQNDSMAPGTSNDSEWSDSESQTAERHSDGVSDSRAVQALSETQAGAGVPSNDSVAQSDAAIEMVSQSGVPVAANAVAGRRTQNAVSFDEAGSPGIGSENTIKADDRSTDDSGAHIDTDTISQSAVADANAEIVDGSPRQVEEPLDETGSDETGMHSESAEGVGPDLVSETASADPSQVALGEFTNQVDVDGMAAQSDRSGTSSVASQSELPQFLTMEGRNAQDQYSQIQASSDAQVVETLSLEEFLRDMSSPVAVKKTSEVIGDAMASSLRLDGKTIEVELHPADLGMLKIHVTQHEHSIEAQIIATEFTTSELLLGQRGQLMDALADLGFDTSDVHISHDDQPSGQSEQQSSSEEFSFQTKINASAAVNRESVSPGGVNIVA